VSEWADVSAEELDTVKLLRSQGLVELRFSYGTWQKRSLPPEQPVPAPEAVPLPAKQPRFRNGQVVTIEDIRSAPPIVPTKDGQWLNQYQECDCGERYLVQDEHVAKSPRHRRWLQGNMEVELPRLMAQGAYSVDEPTPQLEIGKVVICSRCKAKDKKGMSYYPDRESKPDNRYPCIRCNGHGVLPLVEITT
jgi:hypothetical protein